MTKELLNEDILFCLDFFAKNDLINYRVGNYPTPREDINLRIDEYETQIASERFWQSHKYHLDVYVLLGGKERIDVRDSNEMVHSHYDRRDDLVMYKENKPHNINCLTKFGDVLICYPGEAHKTGIHVELKSKIKVALFKIHCPQN